MDLLRSVFPMGIIGILILLTGIGLLGLLGQTLPISYYLSQPLNWDTISRTKVFLRRYGIPFALFFTGGVIFVIAAAIMLVGIFQKALLG